MSQFDYDWIIVGSGFGGSVSALRLAEKNYSVGVLECGKRFGDEDLPNSTWDLRRYFWAPRIGLRGIFRLTPLKDVSVVSGCGVGGGSLGYANTPYVPPSDFFKDSQWGDLEDWESVLAPTTPRRSGCSESWSTRTTIPPTSCCASSASSWESATPTARLPSESSWASPERRFPIPTSTARDRSAPAAYSAGAAWSAARTGRRTRWSRTTSGWPSGAASRSAPTAP